ncbi:CobW family GTP-binding protein [Altericista sp. CCNU0014]|uniref:CobW family GTP-binding protein n=1 Tax=Altericista sp. CCNU0014 TaxID=3082949 RepID=UPI00384BEEE7
MPNPQADQILDLPKRGMPVTVITGFLGSGKTTLLNHILENQSDLKIAVLVNEFGDINIDSQLLVSIDEDMVELSNGCICCTINDNLLEAVYNILERQDKIDYMVIETTGVADPLPIVLTFLGTELRDLTRIDSILTLVDSETFTPEHFGSEAAEKQITFADIIVLNKTDLVSEARVNELETQIRSFKEGARILHSEYGKVALPLILDVSYNDPTAYADLVQEEIRQTEQDRAHDRDTHPHDREHHHHDGHHHGHEHHHHHSAHLDNDGFISVSFQSDRPFSLTGFQNFLDFHLPDDVFRAKGLLWFKESQLRYIFQLSGKRYDMATDEWKGTPSNQIVLIGRNLNPDRLKAALNNCLEPALAGAEAMLSS